MERKIARWQPARAQKWQPYFVLYSCIIVQFLLTPILRYLENFNSNLMLPNPFFFFFFSMHVSTIFFWKKRYFTLILEILVRNVMYYCNFQLGSRDLLSAANFVCWCLAGGTSTSDSLQSTIWAASWQNQQNDCAPSEDSDQPGHSLYAQQGIHPVWSESLLCT